MKSSKSWTIAQYVVGVLALAAFILVYWYWVLVFLNEDIDAMFLRGFIAVILFGIVTLSVSAYEMRYKRKRESIVPESKTAETSSEQYWKEIASFAIIMVVLLVFWVIYYGSISITQAVWLFIIGATIIVAFQGTRKQAEERSADPNGKRKQIDRDFVDYCSCGLTLSILWILLLVWITNGSLPESHSTETVLQYVSVTVIISCFIYGIFKLDTRRVPIETRSPYRRESVFGPPVVGEYAKPRRQISTKRPIPGVAQTITRMRPLIDVEEEIVKVWRSGEFIGSRMRYKVKVQNESEFTVTDVMVYIISFPEESLKLVEEDDSVHFPKLESKGLLTQTFDFMPTQDCVRGEINAGITFVDRRGKVHTLSTKPFVIRSVCDLLLPHRVTPEDFELKLKDLECGEVVMKIDEWTPEEMFEKGLRIVDESNFFEVSNQIEEREGVIYAKISGFALGKYTSKEVGVEISITGPKGKKGASCTIQVSGEDEAMILPTIDDLRERLNAWLCPLCSSPLSITHVEALRDGKVIECPFCKVTIGR